MTPVRRFFGTGAAHDSIVAKATVTRLFGAAQPILHGRQVRQS
jgi:hypothetical protein